VGSRALGICTHRAVGSRAPGSRAPSSLISLLQAISALANGFFLCCGLWYVSLLWEAVFLCFGMWSLTAGLSLTAHLWGTEEVSLWLERLSLSEYKEVFTRHDIRGCELLHLERRDLKELGVTKVGHMKRILHGIRELSPPSVSAD
ncbi:hypothetical protein FKM82_024938, partial [Ascaphus truei]